MNIETIVQEMKKATDFIDSNEFQYAGNEEKEPLDKQLDEMETNIKLMIHQLHEEIEKQAKELQIKENKLIVLMRITNNYGIDMWHHYAEDRLE